MPEDSHPHFAYDKVEQSNIQELLSLLFLGQRRIVAGTWPSGVNLSFAGSEFGPE